MKSTIITSKGTTTIPKEFRDKAGLHPGTRVNYSLDKEGRLVLERALTLEEVRAQNLEYIKPELLRLTPQQIKERAEAIRAKELKRKYGPQS